MMLNRFNGALAACTCMMLTSANAATYYVAPNGEDTNSGTIDHPYPSVQPAQETVVPGDTVYFRGRTYAIPPNQIAGYALNGSYACVTQLTKSGTPDQRIYYFAYPDEQPTFDLSAVKPPGKRVSAFWVDADWLHIKGIEVVGVQVTIRNRN